MTTHAERAVNNVGGAAFLNSTFDTGASRLMQRSSMTGTWRSLASRWEGSQWMRR